MDGKKVKLRREHISQSYIITRGMDSGDYALCLLSMVCIGLVGALLAIITQLLERMVCPWTAKKSN